MAEDEYLDRALAPAFSVWNEAEQAAEDQAEDGEQHRGILRERRLGREQDLRRRLIAGARHPRSAPDHPGANEGNPVIDGRPVI